MTSHSPRPHTGHILLLALVFSGIFLTVGAALAGSVTAYSRAERATIASAQALTLAEGALELSARRLNQDSSYAGEIDTPLGGGTFTITATTVDAKTKQVTVIGYVPNRQNPIAHKTITAVISISGAHISFHYGIQTGQGGFSLSNSSSITGNVFSSGRITSLNNNMIYGDVVSTGVTGLVYGVHATGSIYAHTIGDSSQATTIDKDAYYVTKTNTTVAGALHPSSADQTSVDLPISDTQIAEWESFAEAGGTFTACDSGGDYTITSNTTLGPKKIACNLVVKGNSAILNVTGPLWIQGDISFQAGATVRVDASLHNENVAIIADNPANPTGSGTITVEQNATLAGSGSIGSFVFLISQNRSAESAGTTVAISMKQSAAAVIAYAIHGLISLSQSVGLKEATAYQMTLSQSASITYDTGLPSTLFQSGPGASWSFVPGTYAIVP